MEGDDGEGQKQRERQEGEGAEKVSARQIMEGLSWLQRKQKVYSLWRFKFVLCVASHKALWESVQCLWYPEEGVQDMKHPSAVIFYLLAGPVQDFISILCEYWPHYYTEYFPYWI